MYVSANILLGIYSNSYTIFLLFPNELYLKEQDMYHKNNFRKTQLLFNEKQSTIMLQTKSSYYEW